VTRVKEALEKTRKTPSQTVIPITRGLSVRRTKGGISVLLATGNLNRSFCSQGV